MPVCHLCETTFENSKYLNKNKIELDPHRYLHTCKSCRTIKNCENCKLEFKHYQNRTCSPKCALELKEYSYMISQGTPHNFYKNSKSRIAFENDLLKNEGIQNVFQRETVKNAIKTTMLSKYGVDNISKDHNIKNKKKQTLINTLKANPTLIKDTWWKIHNKFISEIGYDPRLGMFGKASLESLRVFTPLIIFCKGLGIIDSDIYIGLEDKSEFFINTGSKTYFYDFCIRSKKIIIEFNGIGFHANPEWESNKLNEWRSVFTSETSKENIRKSKIKNNAAIQKGFKLLEIWSDSKTEDNINLCKKFITHNI